ncbi:MAG TPA: glycosyltransferase [Alphaproteobacteria bacterium]|nr:glycosyltransferase [Alphaproteobacteria bacterium]
MTKKILLNALHTTTGGGLIYLQNILPYIAEDKRFNFTLLVPPAGLKKLEVPKNVTVWQAPALGFAAGHLWEQLVLPFAARGYDAMWCNANYVPLLARGAIPTIHTTPRAAAQAQSFGMKLYWWGVTWLTRLSIWRAPAVLGVTTQVMRDFTPNLRKARVAPAGAPQVKGKTTKVPRLVVAVGDYYPQKNYPELLRALKLLHRQVPGVRLEIIGRPVDPTVAKLVKHHIGALGLHKTVKETGPLPHDRLLKRLAQAQVFVTLSKAEAFNMPVLEALAVGTPVVAGESAVLRDEIAGTAAVYVPLDGGGDVAQAVATALHGVLLNPGLAATLVRAGRKQAAKFGWEKTARTITHTLADVLASR